MNKKILIIIPGKLEFYKEENYNLIKEFFRNFDVNFFIIGWENQDEKIIENFKKIYYPLNIEFMPEYSFVNVMDKIKYPDHAGNALGTLHMWKSIVLSFEKVNKFFFDKSDKPDYILRYRSDILPKKNQIFADRDPLVVNEILIPDRYHWNGLNDNMFLIRYNDLNLFKNFSNFLEKHIKENKFFCSEYIFQQFLKKSKFKIKYSDFDYNIMRFKNHKKFSKNEKSKKPLADWYNCKLNRLKFKIRNFDKFFIKKSNRNNKQHINI